MRKESILRFLKSTKIALSKHSPEILTGLGIAGMITTTALAVKATPKAIDLMNKKGVEKAEEINSSSESKEKSVTITLSEWEARHVLSTSDKIKAAWKCYIPSALMGLSSIACLIGACSVNARRNAALVTAYSLSETALKEYKDKVVETIGEKKEQAIRDKIAADRVSDNPVSKSEVFITEKGNTLCYDYISKRYFKSDIDKIKNAEIELNRRMLHDITGTASLNEFYNELGLEEVEFGYDLGWNVTKLIDLDISATITDSGEPCIVVGHYNGPMYNYDR